MCVNLVNCCCIVGNNLQFFLKLFDIAAVYKYRSHENIIEHTSQTRFLSGVQYWARLFNKKKGAATKSAFYCSRELHENIMSLSQIIAEALYGLPFPFHPQCVRPHSEACPRPSTCLSIIDTAVSQHWHRFLRGKAYAKLIAQCILYGALKISQH